ncbi:MULTISPECIES: hypothetical protein [Bacteria]|uniref:hypothetical protein n=1 Tax=Bacteria TaxID=2 RepID=UPI003C7D75BD
MSDAVPRRRRERRAVALLGIGLLATLSWIAAPSTTDASFTDGEYAGASVTALTIHPPQIASTPLCQRPPLLGGDVFSIRWRMPAGVPADSVVRWAIDGQVLTTSPATATDPQGYSVSTFGTALLSGLLGSLLGANVKVEMWATSGTWISPTESTMTYYAPLLAGSPTCTIVNDTAG